MRYAKVKSGEWVQPTPIGYKMRCCDCGLVHRIDFRIVEGKVQFRARRDNRATGQIRRHRIPSRREMMTWPLGARRAVLALAAKLHMAAERR